MLERTRGEQPQPIAVDGKTLAFMLGLGERGARKLGKEAGAEFHVGSRTLFNVERVNAHIQTMLEV